MKTSTTISDQTEIVTVAKLPVVGSYDNMKKIIEKNQELISNGLDDGEAIIEDRVMLAETEKSEEYSTTNVQVQEVDEADIVKTNGDYIFYYKNEKRELSIVDVKDERVVETLEYEEYVPNSMYLSNNKLIVITERMEVERLNGENEYYRDMIKLIEYDISDVNNVSIEREVEVEGSFITSRMIEDNIYMMIY